MLRQMKSVIELFRAIPNALWPRAQRRSRGLRFTRLDPEIHRRSGPGFTRRAGSEQAQVKSHPEQVTNKIAVMFVPAGISRREFETVVREHADQCECVKISPPAHVDPAASSEKEDLPLWAWFVANRRSWQ